MAWNDMKSDQMKSDVITILLIVGKERYDDEEEEKKNRYEGRGRRGEEMTETFLKGNKWGIKTREREREMIWKKEKKGRQIDLKAKKEDNINSNEMESFCQLIRQEEEIGCF